MHEKACSIDADENAPPEKRAVPHHGHDVDAILPPTISISNPALTGAGICNPDGTSMVAFGGVTPASCVPTMTAVVLDSNGVQVATGTPVSPTVPPANWAFQFTGMPTGTPRPRLTLVVTATNDILSRSVNRDFSCGLTPTPGNG
jgi:hypothetical protein